MLPPLLRKLNRPFGWMMICLFVPLLASCGVRGSATPAQPTGLPSAPSASITRIGLAVYRPQTACDSPYLPLRQGAAWTYATHDTLSNQTASETITVLDVTGDQQNALATVRSEIPDSTGKLQTAERKYTCDPQGINVPEPTIPSYTLPPKLPAAGQLVAGLTWQLTNQKTIAASAPCWGGGTYTRLSHYAVKGMESIDLPIGMQEALRIEEANPISPLATPSDQCAQSTANTWWLAAGLGVVHHEMVVTHLDGSADFVVVTDLVRYSLP